MKWYEKIPAVLSRITRSGDKKEQRTGQKRKCGSIGAWLSRCRKERGTLVSRQGYEGALPNLKTQWERISVNLWKINH